MPRTFSQLTRSRTSAEHVARILDGMRGIGIPRFSGLGTGDVVLSGTPQMTGSVVFQIVAGGQVGGATWRYSLDEGSAWSDTQATSGAPFAIPTTGLSVAFVDGPAGGGASFIAGDGFSVRLTLSKLPAYSWHPFSFPRALVETEADGAAERDELLSNIARGGYLFSARGPWLDLWAWHMYRERRIEGQHTVGIIELHDEAGAGPYPEFLPGQLYAISDDGKHRFVSRTGGTLLKNGTLSLEFIAESRGASFNVPSGSITTLETPIPGVAVSNPALPASSTWITTQGTDDEQDEDLQERCSAKWLDLAEDPPEDVYLQRAKKASGGQVTRAYARPDPTTPGRLLLDLAGPSGPVGASAVAAVDAALQVRKSLCSTLLTRAAPGVAVTVQGIVYVRAGFKESVQAEALARLAKRFRQTPLSGVTIYLDNLYADLEPDGVRNAVLTLPAANVVIPEGSVPTLIVDLTFTEVP